MHPVMKRNSTKVKLAELDHRRTKRWDRAEVRRFREFAEK
jgi:hypothetical protein